MARFCVSLLVSVLGVLAVDSRAQELGATVQTNSSGSVTNVVFRVWAPNAMAVRVSGEFNNWATNSPVLSLDGATRIWTGAVANARPGQAYKYIITTTNLANGTNVVLWKKDPRARQVRTLTGGAPAHVTSGSSPQASVIYNPSAFDWSGDLFVPPDPKDIVMYELHVGTFYDPTPNDGQPATFDDAIQKLDYLKRLGVNMIALMPVQEFNGRHSWGYNPSDPFAIEETYGGPDAFKRFVKAAHLMDMAVQVDVVHNHYGDLAPNTNSWTSLKTSDLENFDGGEPYFYNQSDETGTNAPRLGISKTKWGPRPRYIDPNVRAYILDNIKMYLDEYKVWALRWDSPRNITGYQANPASAVIGDPNAQIPEAISMMQEIHAEIRSPARTNSSRYYSIAEDAFNPNDPAPVLGGYHAHWEISYHDAFFSRLLATNAPLPPPFNLKYTNGPATMDTIKFRVENKEDPGFRVTFLENHDKCGDHNSATDGKRLAHDFDTSNPASLNAQRKTMMAAAATLASAGTPMLWMGQEQLADGDFNDKKALDWNRAAQFPGIVRFHRDMVHLRNTLPALKAAGTNASQTPFASVVTNNQTNGLLAFRRQDGISGNNDVLVAMNFSDTTNALPTNARSGGFTNAILNSHTTNYAGGLTNIGPMPGSVVAASSNVTMGPWSVLIFARTNVPLPANDTNGNGIDDGIDLLTGSRAALPGSFNSWDTNSLVMKWDDASKTYRYVARFAAPGVQSFRVLTTNWFPPTNQPAFSFTNTNVSTWEIRFTPSNGLAQISNLGTNDVPDAWKSFHFGTNAFSPSADSDGDNWSNLEEFRRGSDPTLHEETRFAVVGHLNGWTWADAAVVTNAFQMRYVGHGLWKFFRWFPIGTTDFSFKISQGPTENDPNWGASSNATNGFAEFQGSNNFRWLTNLETWQVLTFNERNGGYSIETFATNSRDTDNDGMPDDWELFSGLDPTASADATGDTDGDSVRNSLEFGRGSSARDASDHYLSMSIPGNAFPFSPSQSAESWQPSEPRVAMKWNTNDARWHGLRYVPTPQTLRFKFAANQSWTKAWNWRGTNDVVGVALANNATSDIIHQFAQAGYYTVIFDEHSGRYNVTNMSVADNANTNGLADYWEWFHGGSGTSVDPDGDLDGDAVLNKFEFGRGSDPRNASDHYSVLALPGDTLPFSARSGWESRSDSRLRMVWRTNDGHWEFLRFVPRPGSYQVRAANSPFGDSDWAGTTGNHTLNFTSRGHYIVQFEEFSKTYTPVPMPTNDVDKNGVADYWQTYLSQPNAAADTDGDGVTALGEYLRGSDPNAKDKSSVMHVHGHVSDWNFTNAVPMRWNSSFGIWEALVWTRQTNESPQRAKFVSVTNPTAAWANSNWGDGFTNRIPPISPDGVADRDGNDIAYTLPALPFHVLFEFDEVWGDYFAGPIGTNDSDNDGLADEWAAYHRLSSAGGNPDNDSWLNISEFRRGSNPTNADGDSKRMSVSGDTPTLPIWNPAADNMTWSDQRLRWEWSGTFASSKTVSFRFAPGAWDRWPNMSASVTGGVRYLIHFDDITGQYDVIPHPVWLDWLKSNNLDTSTPRNPWPLDSDGDGIANFQEYALGGNPNLRDRTALPTNIVTNIAGSNHLVLRWFERTNKDSSLNVNPQLSTNLGSANWSSLSNSVITNADINGIPPGHLRKEVSVPMQGSGSFLRLKIQGP